MVARLRAGSCRRLCSQAGSPGVQSAGGLDDRRDKAFERATVFRSLFRPDRERQRCAHRVHRRDHDFPHHGLHRVRQPANPRQCGHGQGRGVRRDLHRGRGLDLGDGALRQLPHRARAGHGAQCVLRVHRGARPQIQLAAGARRRVLLRGALLSHFHLQHPRIHHQLDPEESQIGDLRRRRALSRHHRARGSQDRGRQPGDAGHARRSQAVAGDPVSRRLHRDRGAQLPQRHRRHAHRHPRGGAHRPAAGARRVHRHRVGAALARADLPAARFLPRRGAHLHHHRVQFSHGRRVRQRRHADRRRPPRRVCSTPTATCRA